MNIVTLDFETYYDDEYSLKKMSTEEYVTDPRFEIIGVGAKINDAPSLWYTGSHDQIGSWLRGLGVWDSCVIAHNAKFDMLILKVVFGRLPKMMLCTMSMAQPFLRPFTRSVSLENCAEVLNLPGAKGTYVSNMKGRYRASLSKQELVEYGEYCKNDCELEKMLFDNLVKRFPRDELYIIDLTLRMYLEPAFVLDAEILAETLQVVQAEKETLLQNVPANVTPAILRSNDQFAKLLTEMGVDVPMKTSKVTGKMAPALAKNDTGWKELEELYQDDGEVYPILLARLGAKSTLEETRSQRLLDIAVRYGWFRIPLNYYAAHTGRYGGTEKINAQNLPQVRRSKMRFGVCAPEGWVVLAADLAQIEARITAFLAGQLDLLKAFAEGRDIYSEFASIVFRTEVIKGRSKEDDKRRFVGKTCILGLGYGMSAKVLQSTLRKDGLKFSLIECDQMVQVYRHTYNKIPSLWRKLDHGISVMGSTPAAYTRVGPVTLGNGQIILPNNMPLTYANLHRNEEDPQMGWVYEFGGETRKLWGGTVAENIVQALARIVIMDNMLRIHRELGYRPALQQHDELDYVIREEEAEEAKTEMSKIMVTPPSWMPNLPLAVEINYGPSLGDCK